jgi:DNA polymerase III alpha subunit (gram-positive type)
MNKRCFIVTDVETTGLSPEVGHEITQLSALALDPVTLQTHHIGEFNMFIKPQNPELASPEALRAARASFDTAMAEGLDRKLVLQRFNDWAQRANPSGSAMTKPIFTAFNAGFDCKFVDYLMYAEGVWKKEDDKVFSNAYYDVWQIGFTLFESDQTVTNMTLDVILQKLGINRQGKTHDAMEDVRLTAQILQRYHALMRRIRPRLNVLSQAEIKKINTEDI